MTHPWPSPRSPSVTSLVWRTWSARSHPSPSTRYYAVPDTAVPDTALPDPAVPNTAVPDTAVPDTRPRSLCVCFKYAAILYHHQASRGFSWTFKIMHSRKNILSGILLCFRYRRLKVLDRCHFFFSRVLDLKKNCLLRWIAYLLGAASH